VVAAEPWGLWQLALREPLHGIMASWHGIMTWCGDRTRGEISWAYQWDLGVWDVGVGLVVHIAL
jgi:hypothetical protein